MLKRVKHSPEIDLIKWYEDDDTQRPETVHHDAMTKMLRERFVGFEVEDDDASFNNKPHFPYEWSRSDGISGELPDDPLTIYIDLPLGSKSDGGPVWSLTVTECVDSLIDNLENDVNSQTLKINETANAILIRDALRAAAQRIDDTLSQEWEPVSNTKG